MIRSGSLPSLPPEFDLAGTATATSAPLPAAVVATASDADGAAEAVLPPGTELSGGDAGGGESGGGDGDSRAISWGPAIR